MRTAIYCRVSSPGRRTTPAYLSRSACAGTRRATVWDVMKRMSIMKLKAAQTCGDCAWTAC